MSTLSKLAQYNNNSGVAPTSVGVASKKESTSTLGKLQNYAQQAAEEQAIAAQSAAEGEQNKGGFFGGLGYLGEKIGLGFLSGIEGIWDYTAGGLAKLFGADDWAEQQFANDWVNYSHADEWYNPSDGWKVAGDVAGGIGTSLPAIAGVAAAAAIAYFSGGSLSGVSAGIISGVIAGLGAAGNSTKEAYRETGELGGKEFGYGALSGITEAGVEVLSAGIGTGTGAIVKNISKSFGKEVAKTAARETVGKAIIKGFIGEAFEEGLGEFLDPYWKRLTYDPEAKNATAQEIGYAALIGGLSGAIMGGFDATVRSTANTIRGNNIVNKGTATDVITTAENIANSEIYTDQYESFGAVKNILNELQTSMQKTDGEIRTVKQKMLLGYLERANTYTVFEPMVQKNAARIVANADAIAERLNTYGYTDAQGKPITYTAEQIRAGIDTNNPKSYAKALKTNNILRTLAVIDATGQLYMDTKKFEAATLRGETLSSQVDLNRFIETASQEELHSVAEKLDIADWQGLTNEQFKEKIVAFAERGGIEEYQTEQRTNADIKAAADAVDVQKAKTKIPQKFTEKKDGVTRYTQGGVDMAVIKNGDSYRIYDYESGKLSKPLTLQQVNERLTEIRGKVDSVVNTAAVESITTEESRQATEIDAYAAENISAYSKLSDANKSLVRGVIRQARAAGISEADSLSYARVAAHAGINISFDKQAKVGDIEILKVGTDENGNAIYADGVYFPETNSIYVNPEAKRSQERLLIHELTHAIFTTSDGKVFLMDGVDKMSAAEKETIIKRYIEAGHGGTVEIIDEINAHFAEGQLQNKKLLKRLTEEKPSFKQKILSFFKKSSSEYSSDERLSGVAKKLYKQYKKMFDSFVAENQHNNAFEPVKISEAADSSRMALPDALKTLGEYSETRKRHIESREYDTISRDYNEISEFIKSANKLAPVKRLHIGTISDATADLVFKKTGVDIKNYDFVLASNYIAHIFDGHGDANVETPRGQKAVTFANIENILETVISPDDVSLVSDNNGTALRFEKRLDGRNVAITVTSTKKSTLTLKSAWIINESGGRAPSANAVTLAGTSETSGRNSTTHSISKNTEKVNGKQGKTPKNVKYALPETDSRGKKLTNEQRNFFADSKVVDEQGRLLEVYHGTNDVETKETWNETRRIFDTEYTPFTVFKKKWDGQAGHFFGRDIDNAGGYGSRVYKCYLNITNPFVTNNRASLDLLYERINNTRQDIAEYSAEKGIGGSEFWQISNYLDDIGKDVSKFIRELGFDGIIHDSYGVKEFVVYDSNQIKLASNKTPTVNSDIRFALDDSDRDVRGNYTAGQRAKFAANNTAMKVYSRSDAESVISAIMDERLTFDDGKYGVLAGKNRTEVVNYLFKKLNTAKEGYRIGVALKIADYLIDNITLSDMYAAETVSESMRTLSALRYYMHKMDLSGIQSEIKYRYDNKNTINLLWAAPKGERGIAPDTLAQSLESDGIFLSGWNGADMFFEMVDMYESARRDVQESVQQQSLKDYGGKEQLEKLRQDIARDILLAYDNKGTKSKYAKLVEKYTTQIQSLKQQVREANSYNRLVNSVVDKAQHMRDLKLGTFLNSTQYKNDVFKSSIEGLARIKNRGNFNVAGTRKILADLRTWYTTDNPILADTYEQGIADMLDSLSVGNKRFTKEELATLNNVMAYFTKYVENFNKVYKNGKWVEAIPEATRYIDTIHANSELKVGLFRKLAGTTYMQTFGDPMTVARRMDMYEPNGFYTETLQQLRDAAVDSQIAEMEIMSNYDAFMKKNKKYLAQITKETVSYGGKDVPRSVLIGLYMTLKRQHAQAGLAQNGFAYVDTDGKRVRVDGFAPNIETDAELYFSVVEEQKKIESLLSAADKEYIAILERAYNNDAKKLKADRDMQRLGFTNATEDYYYPIRRGNIAKNVDTSDVQGEIDRVSNSSFNKDTVRGAKQELFIESADTVFKRHIHAVCQYAFLSPAIETYNRIFNLDVSGNPNKPVSVATESANTWAKGNKYFSKLISDIQGIPTSSGEGNKVLGFIRGNYAKFQLGANPKVWVTQLSSLFASSSILDADSITKGMFISAKDVDTYCSLAKLRNNDNTAALAQGVLDKLGKVSDVLMAPIGKMDRFVVCRLFGACQAQVAKNGGAKIGTEANKIAAGQLLRRVILETQQNSIATERSAAMRSGNEILRTVTMFTADSMKVVGRVIDSIGELSTLKAKLKATSNADVRATLQKSIKLANRKVRKSVTSLVTSALFMAAVAQLFSWLYNKDKKDDESTAQTVLVDFLGNLIGGLPVIKDIYARIAQGYDFSNYAYSSINDLLDSSINLVEAAKNLVSGDASQQDIAKSVKNLSYSLGQMFGVPTRNIYNVAYGLTKRISPVSAYKIDNQFYKKNYVSDLNKALENDDAEMVSYIMSLIYNQRIGDMVNEETRQKLSGLYAKGYSILPRSIGDSIRYDGNEIEMNDTQKKRFMSIYSQANRYIEKLLASSGYGKLSEEKQAKAIKSVYDAFYYQAISDLVGQDANNTLGELSRYIAIEKLAVVFSGLSEIVSDVDSKGNTVSGSRKKNTVAYLLKQNLSDGERLLIMCYRGYSIQDGDYKGYTEQRAKIILLKYILNLKVTQAEKAKIAAECGFTVKNGKIDRSSLYSGVGNLSKKNK